MIIVDRALAQRQRDGNPIRVGMVGAGAMGKAIALQIQTRAAGIELVALANRTLDHARQAFLSAGVDKADIAVVDSAAALDAAVRAGRKAITDDALLVCATDSIDVLIEVTGAVEFGAQVVTAAIDHGRTVITMNAELQGTVGPILRHRADRAGVLITDSDGDQPGVMMNLHRFVEGLGLTCVLLGNMKGLQDAYRNPTTQEGFAKAHHLSPQMAASFADGTKMSFEMSLVANATGLRAGTLGLYGPDATSVYEAADLFAPHLDQLLDGGLVDYVVGAQPGPGVFALGYHDDPEQRRWLQLYKLGDGPLYTFYTPYHLCHLEVPNTIGRVVLFGDPVVTPDAGHVVEVVATAKRDLRTGEVIDAIGWYMTYGQCENADQAAAADYLPMGVAEGCTLIRDVAKDSVLTLADVRLPEGRLIDLLRDEQRRLIPPVPLARGRKIGGAGTPSPEAVPAAR
jgi:predicted homoserine dehydrogenase-like protein